MEEVVAAHVQYHTTSRRNTREMRVRRVSALL